MCFAPQRRALFRHLNVQKRSEHQVFCTFWLRNVLRATTACTFSTSEPPKVVRTWCVLYILTWKCASRHNGVHFFDISTSKSGPTMVCFVHFDLEMCFAPQRRALFRHLNLQKRSEHQVFCTFWLGNVLRATTACTFSTSELPKALRAPGVLHILTWKCASRHNGVQFSISHLASWLRTRNFREPTFRPSGSPNHLKNVVFRDFPTFSRICIFFLLTLSLLLFFLLIFLFSLPLPCSAFHLSILSEVWLLNFLRSVIVDSCFMIATLLHHLCVFVTGIRMSVTNQGWQNGWFGSFCPKFSLVFQNHLAPKLKGFRSKKWLPENQVYGSPLWKLYEDSSCGGSHGNGKPSLKITPNRWSSPILPLKNLFISMFNH